MSGSTKVFHAKIVGVDAVSSVLDKIEGKFVAVEHRAEAAGHKVQEIEHASMFDRFHEHIRESSEKFGELHASVVGVGESLSELVPALGALSIGAGVAGLVEAANKVSEKFAQISHSAQILGVTTDELQRMNAVAYLTDTSVDGLQRSMQKMNVIMDQVARGKNRDAAELFHKLGMDVKHYHSALDALPDLAEKFEKITNPKLRADILRTLGGRTAQDLAPMLALGHRFKEEMAEADSLIYKLGPRQETLDRLDEMTKHIHLLSESIMDEVGADFAPTLNPALDHLESILKQHRGAISAFIGHRLKPVESWIEGGGLERTAERFDRFGSRVDAWVSQHGGWEAWAEAAGAVMGASLAARAALFVARPLIALASVGAAVGKAAVEISGLTKVWEGVGGAAEAAMAAQKAALAAGGAPGTANPLGPGFNAGKLGLKGLALGGLTLGAMMDAQNGVQISQDDVRNDPSLRAQLTPAQLASLPKHRGLEASMASMFGDSFVDQPAPGHSFVGDAFSNGWRYLFGGGAGARNRSAYDSSLSAAPGGVGPTPFLPAPGHPGAGGVGPTPFLPAPERPVAQVDGAVKVTVQIVGSTDLARTSAVASGNANVTVTRDNYPNRAFAGQYP